MISQNELKTKLQELLFYAQKNLSLKEADVFYTQNALLDLFKLDAPTEAATSYPKDFQKEVLDVIIQYAIEQKMIEENEKLLFETKLMGIVSLRPSQTIEKFDAIAANSTIKDATDWFFNTSTASNYIRVQDIQKNIKWSHKGKIGNVDITINLSKPEIDPKQIAHIEAIILSMTKEERRNPDIIKASRKTRIAAGSGTSVQEVNKLLQQFEQMKKMMKQVSS